MNKRFTIIGLLLGLLLHSVYAQQVGINTADPNALTALDVQHAIASDGTILPQGMMVPRLTQEQRDMIDVSNKDLANSLLIYNTDEDCFNFYSRNEERWKSICGDESSIAIVSDMDCNSIRVEGAYQAGVSLTSSNFMEVSVIVSKSGSYDIRGISKSSNGYYFHSGGVFLAAGTSILTIPGLGTPITSQLDTIVLSVNGTTFCEQEINVSSSDAEPDYTIDCSLLDSTSVSGRYIAGQALSGEQNMVFVTIRASDEAIGSTYIISSDTVNGYSFSGKGVITQASQRIALYAQGTPGQAQKDVFTLRTNTLVEAQRASCPFQVKVATRAITILGIGENNTYYLGADANGMNRVLSNQALFGPNQTATVSVSEFNIIRPGIGNGVNVASYISAYNPDIIIIQYNWIGGAYGGTTASVTALTEFVNKGGVLILCSDGDGQDAVRNRRCEAIINSIFGGATFRNTAYESDNVQQIATGEQSTAPVISGPFKDLKGEYIARDAGSNFSFNISDWHDDAAIIAYSGTGNVRAFMHKSKGFVFFGDGAPFAYSAGSTSPYTYPMKLDSAYNPIFNTYDGYTTYNSHLFCNIMAWAIGYVKERQR